MAVIFRRGPSKQVRLIQWNRKTDTFQLGQWFKSRIYERRCDLSPDGKYLAYFAANYKKPLFSWTAISRPPYLTALALWAKGDGWGGGGLFDSEHTFLLNHRQEEATPHEDLIPRKSLKVKLLGERPGWGEDDPICHLRLIRDGWILKSSGESVKPNWNAKIVWDYEKQPIIYEKTSYPRSNTLILQAKIKGINKRGGAWYQMDHEVIDENASEVISLPDTDWADWDSNDDLLFSKAGNVFRAKRGKNNKSPLLQPKEIADFNSMKFEAMTAPESAKKW